jgi:hypothetical protein
VDFSAPASDCYPDLFTVQVVVTFRPGERQPKPLQYNPLLTLGSGLITAMQAMNYTSMTSPSGIELDSVRRRRIRLSQRRR